MNIKDLFHKDKRESLLQDALKKARAKKGGEFPFAFGMMGGDRSILVIDRRGEFRTDKLLKEIRKERPRKLIVGTAKVSGRLLELTVDESKGTVKAKDVRDFLTKNNLPVTKAVIAEQKGGSAKEDEAANQRQGARRDSNAA